MVNQKKFGYGYQFQSKLIASFLSDETFMMKMFSIIQHRYFQNQQFKWFSQFIFDYYQQYTKIPMIQTIQMQLKTQTKNVQLLKQTLDDIIKFLTSPDLDYVKDKAINFCKNQKIKQAFVKSLQYMESQDYESMQTILFTALNSGKETNIGKQLFASIQQRYNPELRKVVPTPWPLLNHKMQGGLGRGELGVIAAPPGTGKSHALVQITTHALNLGCKVMFFSFQLNEDYTLKRIDSNLLKIPVDKLQYHIQEIKQAQEKIKDTCFIKHYPMNSQTVYALKAHIIYCKRLLNFNPDMIVVDYGDIIKPSITHTNSYFSIGQNYVDLKMLAQQLDIPIWTASQVGKSGSEKQFIDKQDLAHSYKKIQIADFALSILRKVQDKVAGTGVAHIMKNRFGVDGFTYACNIDTGISEIKILQNNTKQSLQIKNNQKNNEFQKRSKLKQRLQMLQNNKEN